MICGKWGDLRPQADESRFRAKPTSKSFTRSSSWTQALEGKASFEMGRRAAAVEAME